jgi:predicted enzyme related to lactoylglutathione lyase
MASRLSHISIDARNAYQQSLFWAQVLDWNEDPEDPNLPEHEECLIMARDRGQMLLFITVPDDKVVKNRVHLDLRPTDRTREDEVERLVGLGAVELADFRRADGSGWITLADPEGNEFCVLAQRPAGSGPTT